MNCNLPRKTKSSAQSGLRIDRITRIINEQWPEIWEAAVNRQNQYIENRRVLILAARDQLRRKVS
jgi:hypothetical protein